MAFLAVAVGRIGFNPTDEGMVLAYAARMLRGQVPHRDFITPRPVGSALLHMAEFAIPGPLLLKSHVIALCELTAIAMLFGVLVFRKTPARWSPVQAALVVAALVITMHTFPLMAWSPVDGMLLSLVGVVLLLPASGAPPGRRRRWAGLVIAGVAVTTKQGFFLMPLIAAFIAASPMLSQGRAVFLRRFLVSGAISAAPAALYAGALSALGAGPAMVAQLLSQHDVDLLALFKPFGVVGLLLVITFSASTALAIRRVRRYRPSLEPAALRSVAAVALLLCMLILAAGRLAFDGDWGSELVQVLIAYIAVGWAATGRLDVAATFIAALALMVSLSLGYRNPDLCAGGVALVLVWRAVSSIEAGRILFGGQLLYARAAAAAAIAGVAIGASLAARTQDIYREPPAAMLTASVSNTIPAFAGIEIDPTTQRYLMDITLCIRRYPAASVAVLPDNQVLYPALGIHSPLPIDWLTPWDYQGSEQRLIDAARAVDARGRYLVLFQTIDPILLSSTSLSAYEHDATEAAVHPDEPLPYAPGVLQAIRDAFHGSAHGCGSFIAVYRP